MKEPGDGGGILRVLTSRSETRAFYDKISAYYDRLAEKSEAPIRQAGLEMLDARPGERILEIGSGTGPCLVDLAVAVGPEGQICAVDLSAGMVAVARARLEAQRLADRVQLRIADATALPAADGTYDAVFLSFTLELFDTPEIPRVLAECRRVLRPGGRIVVVGMSKEGSQGLMVQAFEWTHRHFPNFLDCRPIFVRRSLDAAGFLIRQEKRLQMWVPVEVVLGVNPPAP